MIGHDRLTAVMAVFNAAPMLPRLLAQLDAAWDVVDAVVLVDDGSSDGTAAVLTSWAATRPRVMVLHNMDNRGVAASRNRALGAVGDGFVWFIDHDDHLNPEPLRRLTAVPVTTDVVWFQAEYRADAAGRGRRCDGLPEEQVRSARGAAALLLGGKVDGFLWSKLIRRSSIPANPFPPMSSQSDIVGVARVLRSARDVWFVPECVYHWLRRPGSISRQAGRQLDNLLEAHRLVLLAFERFALSTRLQRRFTGWFLCRAFVLIPIRVGGGVPVRRRAALLLREWLSPAVVRALLPADVPLAVLVVSSRVAPTLTRGAVGSAAWGRDSVRSLSNARTALVSPAGGEKTPG